MLFLHIDPSSDDKEIEKFNDYLKKNKNMYILFYLEGCGPCNATRPEWKKIKNILMNKYDDTIVVADVDQSLMNKLNINIQPKGFPAMYHVSNKGKTYSDYDDSNISNKDRTIDSFVEWIKTTNKQKNMVGGKWSLKYKRSINCNRPKGFSQKQHCKYGRKKSNLFKIKTKKYIKHTRKTSKHTRKTSKHTTKRRK
jgi:thiol-disulfide isomerase/thioredoxin